MSWPALTDFSDAVQNPRLCFQGTELEAGKVAVNQRGLPLVFSGNFACVYSVSVGNRKYAVRCFTRAITDQQSRYGQLDAYLKDVLPPAFVYFEYLDRGISFKGDWYPIVKMEWVDGEPLSKFVGSRLNEPDTLRRIAGRWRGGTTASLRGLRIAHNDLQHGNVMVQTDGNIRLVDYDGIFLPQFRGERSPELGHKNYQHPQRSSEDYDDYVDNFPSLVIYLSLLAIASDPGLWSFYNDDNLIFTRNDFADPGKSPLFDLLKKSPDQTVAKLTERLENYCALPVEKVPDLEAALQGIPSVRAPSPAGSTSRTNATAANHDCYGIPADTPRTTVRAGAPRHGAGPTSACRAASRQSCIGSPACHADSPAGDSFMEYIPHCRHRSCSTDFITRTAESAQESDTRSRGHGYRGCRGYGGADGVVDCAKRMGPLGVRRRPLSNSNGDVYG